MRLTYFSGVYSESIGIQGEGAYRKLHITLLKIQAGFLTKLQTTFALTNRLIWKMVTGVLLQIHFCCFTLPLAEEASSVIVSLASWEKLEAPSA